MSFFSLFLNIGSGCEGDDEGPCFDESFVDNVQMYVVETEPGIWGPTTEVFPWYKVEDNLLYKKEDLYKDWYLYGKFISQERDGTNLYIDFYPVIECSQKNGAGLL